MIEFLKSLIARYVLVSGVFWVLALVVVNDGSHGLHVFPLGAVVNVALLPALWRKSEVVRTVLVLEAGASAIVFGVVGLILDPQPSGALAFVAVFQVVLLWQIGRSWSGRQPAPTFASPSGL